MTAGSVELEVIVYMTYKVTCGFPYMVTLVPSPARWYEWSTPPWYHKEEQEKGKVHPICHGLWSCCFGIGYCAIRVLLLT